MATFPIIDSHVHLYATSHLPHLNWTATLAKEHVLNRQNSIHEYKEATKQCKQLQGFIFVEVDRKHDLNEAGWKQPLEEIAFLACIAQGKPIDGEGHSPEDSSLMLGMVPWAPLPAGPAALDSYIARARQVCQSDQMFSLIKGFRYLLQDKAAGTMLKPDFIAGLQRLGEHGFTFDLGVDFHQGGIDQLQEACDMLERLYCPGNLQRIVINHFCKPDLHLTAEEALESEAFMQWSTCVRRMASYPDTFMKLSGFFSEMPPQDENTPSDVAEMVIRVRPWVNAVFLAFSPARVMFGSDWPVCSAGGPGSESWQHWLNLIVAVLDDRKLNDNEKRQIWSLNAARAYGIEMPIEV